MKKTFKLKEFETEDALSEIWDWLREEKLLNEVCGIEELKVDIDIEVKIKEK